MNIYPVLPPGSTLLPAPAGLVVHRYDHTGRSIPWGIPVVALASIPEAGGVRVVALVCHEGQLVRADEVAREDRTRLHVPGASGTLSIPPMDGEVVQ